MSTEEWMTAYEVAYLAANGEHAKVVPRGPGWYYRKTPARIGSEDFLRCKSKGI